MKVLSFVIAILFVSSTFAADKLSDSFSLGIVTRVCNKGICKTYSDIQNAQIILSEDPKKPGTFTGEAKFQYAAEEVKLLSSVTLSDFDFQGSHQINFYIKTAEVGSSEDLGSAEVIVDKVSQLNSVAQYSAPIIRGDLRIEPTIVLGASVIAVKQKMSSILK